MLRDGRVVVLLIKVNGFLLQAGDVVRLGAPGRSGSDNLAERLADAIEADMLDTMLAAGSPHARRARTT